MTEAQVKTPFGKLFGGMKMTWPRVLLFAVATAVLTALVLVVPFFKGTSFHMIGVTLEAWILFAVFVMANCASPLDSALKTFVFFLVSQPLIYLFQVPFSWMGWGLFRFYRYWFILTLCTFPAAFVGWYITKRSWLSVLIFAPVIVALAWWGFGYLREAAFAFPTHLLAGLFCFGQIALYILAFFPGWKRKAVGAVLALATVAALAVVLPQMSFGVYDDLPGEPSFSADAAVSLEDPSFAEFELIGPATGRFHAQATRTGSTVLTIADGGVETRYTFEVYYDDAVPNIRVKPLE